MSKQRYFHHPDDGAVVLHAGEFADRAAAAGWEEIDEAQARREAPHAFGATASGVA